MAALVSPGNDLSGAGVVDQRTGSSPDPNTIAKGSVNTQTILNGHTAQILRLQALINKLIEKNNLEL